MLIRAAPAEDRVLRGGQAQVLDEAEGEPRQAEDEAHAALPYDKKLEVAVG